VAAVVTTFWRAVTARKATSCNHSSDHLLCRLHVAVAPDHTCREWQLVTKPAWFSCAVPETGAGAGTLKRSQRSFFARYFLK
jgi:hypothetical protein